MKHALCIKYLGSLRPADEAATQYFQKIKDREIVAVKVSRPRNLQFHKKYWALISLVWNNLDQERYPSTDDLHGAIKIAVGLRTRIELPNGVVGFIPGSIAFHKMDEFTFGEFYDKVADLVAQHFIPGISVQALKEEVEALL